MNGSATPAAADDQAPSTGRRRPRSPLRSIGFALLATFAVAETPAPAIAATRVARAEGDTTSVPPAPDSSRSGGSDSTAIAPTSLVHSGARTDGIRIGSIEIIPRNLFDPLPNNRMRPLMSLANRLRVKTRARTVREQLLFERGDPWNDYLARETERNLRQLNFLNPDRIEARRQGDSVLVTVITRDVWSTSVEFNLESADRKRYGSMALTERNLLGLGKSISFLYREDAVGISRKISVDDPGVLGSRWRLRYAAEKGASGSNDLMSAGVPFYAEETPFSYGATWARTSSIVRLYRNADQIAEIAQRRVDAEAYWGVGARRHGLVRRFMVSYFNQDRTLGETMLGPGLTPADVPAEFLGPIERLHLRRFEIEGRLWRPHFVERYNVDRMEAIEDVDLGRSFAFKLGYSPEFLGATAGEGFARARLEAGVETPFGYGFVRGGASSRLLQDPREIVAQVDGRWINQSIPGQSLVLAGFGVLGSRVGREFQVQVGGLSGLRGYPVQAIAGRRLVRFNVEDRWLFARNVLGAASLGAVGFSDLARAWGPGDEPSGWFVSAGVGLRLALPHWSPDHVLRVDVAWPVEPTRDGGHASVLSFGSSQAF